MLVIIVKEPGKAPEEREIKGDLESLKEIVGGYIEMVTLPRSIGLVMVCNEEGKLKGMLPNFPLGFDMIVGTVFFSRTRGPELTSVYVGDLEKVKRLTWGYGGEK